MPTLALATVRYKRPQQPYDALPAILLIIPLDDGSFCFALGHDPFVPGSDEPDIKQGRHEYGLLNGSHRGLANSSIGKPFQKARKALHALGRLHIDSQRFAIRPVVIIEEDRFSIVLR